MSSSMALLLVLQVIWLKSEYEGIKLNFRKETNYIFSQSVKSVFDSLVQINMQPVDNQDTSFNFTHKITQSSKDSSQQKVIMFNNLNVSLDARKKNIKIDTLTKDVFIKTTSDINLVISSPSNLDSIKQMIHPIISKLEKGEQNKHFYIRLDLDSVDKEDIALKFGEELQKAGINLEYKVIDLQPQELLPEDMQSVFDFTKAPPFMRFGFHFLQTNSYFIQKLLPLILFSTFLTVLVGLSFMFIYRSLIVQQKLIRLKNDFISNITHELKTPIATVSVAIEALQNFNALENPQLTKEYLEIAQQELNRLGLLTEKVLKTALFEEKGIILEKESVNLKEIIEKVLSSMRLVMEQKNANCSTEMKGSDFTVTGSIIHLSNVLYNLLDNSLKYNKKGIKINVILEEYESEILLVVNDNGIGIAPEYQQKVFEKFFRVPTDNVHNTKGYGLGLSYVASVIEAHQGKVFLESELGQGSSFKILLPKNI
ncbi:MAG: HAMP domain-containing sensor histidine kinase [Flammeovirgaceae bacterium]